MGVNFSIFFWQCRFFTGAAWHHPAHNSRHSLATGTVATAQCTIHQARFTATAGATGYIVRVPAANCAQPCGPFSCQGHPPNAKLPPTPPARQHPPRLQPSSHPAQPTQGRLGIQQKKQTQQLAGVGYFRRPPPGCQEPGGTDCRWNLELNAPSAGNKCAQPPGRVGQDVKMVTI